MCDFVPCDRTVQKAYSRLKLPKLPNTANPNVPLFTQSFMQQIILMHTFRIEDLLCYDGNLLRLVIILVTLGENELIE